MGIMGLFLMMGSEGFISSAVCRIWGLVGISASGLVRKLGVTEALHLLAFCKGSGNAEAQTAQPVSHRFMLQVPSWLSLKAHLNHGI